MAWRSRGRGRGRGRGGSGFPPPKQEPFVLFPEIEGLGTAENSVSAAKKQLIKWSNDLRNFWVNSSPYYYQDRSERPKSAQKPDVERYSDRNSQKTKDNLQLADVIRLDPDHVPAELAEVGKRRKLVSKKIRWKQELGQDVFDKFEKMDQAEGEGEEEEEEDEEEEEEVEEESGDEGDYEQNKDFDDDEDDFNMADEGDDEPLL